MIGIIGAMDSEVDTLFARMTSKEKINLNHLIFYKGKLYDKDVVIVKCGIGKVNAALCTQLLILTFKVSKVINTGNVFVNVTPEGKIHYTTIEFNSKNPFTDLMEENKALKDRVNELETKFNRITKLIEKMEEIEDEELVKIWEKKRDKN